MTETKIRPRGCEYVHAKMAGAHAKFHVPSAREIDGWVYLTGVIAAHEEGDAPGYAAGFERAFAYTAEILALADCDWNDVVSITSHHLDIGAQLGEMAQVKDGYCDAPYPAWSVLGAASLANPSGFCELVVVARKPD
ncbi:MAG: Rid family hydrolase [Candidatus Andeanibacterium colombiense]|uniref:Rid family hydrolase n=1 Tax=Candidatus Andeanibacterium colombiense TaxID=3121345 RepID=A0AAJ6BPE4_9SPHN|nr:MAG: Rid family hydrolase [Sphingomonadaceae bacterium]